jgi:hypothetical protein
VISDVRWSVLPAREGVRQMELYINNSWTERYANTYIAEAIAWSENGNHATIYTVGPTAEEADAKLMGALGELKLMPEMSKKPNA